jgi:hypothetical protein
MKFNSLDGAAWSTARDTGALSFMPYNEVQSYSDLYMLEDVINQQVIAIAHDDFLAGAPFAMGIDPGHLPPDEYARLLHDNAAVEIELSTMKQFVQQFDGLCLTDLKK